jgi:hypothetical protein
MNVEQLVAGIARETAVKLSTADPVLASAAINEILLNRTLAKFDRLIKPQADRVTAASAQAVVDAKKEAEALLSEGGEWAQARIKAAVEAASAAVLTDLRQETAKSARARRVAVRAAWVTVIVGLVILSGLGGLALAAIGPHGDGSIIALKQQRQTSK